MPDKPQTPAQPPTRSIPLSEPQKWRAFWVCIAVAAITILDLSKVNVALPSIEQALGSSSTALQLIVSGYVLTFGLVLVPAGRLGDQRSRRLLFIIGLSLFTITSLLCAVAGSTEMLMIGRLLQGIAAGLQMPQVIGLIQHLFRGKERGRAFGLFGAIIGISTAFGPTLGGLLIELGGPTDGWRWIFWMNVPLCLVAIVFVLFASAFVAWERGYAARGRQPLVPLRLFRISSYRNGTLLMAAYFTATPAMFLLTTLYLQIGLGMAAVYAGMVTIGFALSNAASSWIGGNLVNRYGRQVVVWGLVGVLIAVGGLTATALLVPPDYVAWVMAAVMVVGGLGGGLVISPNQTLTLIDIPVKRGGVAGSVGQLGQRIGTSIGTAVALSLFYSTIDRDEGTAPTHVAYHDAYARGPSAAWAHE